MRNKWKTILWLLGSFPVVLFLLLYVAHIQTTSRIDDYKAKLRASGEKLSIEDWIPPKLPPERNSADLLLESAKYPPISTTFFSSNPPPVMRMIAPGKAMIGWKQPDIRDSVYDQAQRMTNTWEEADAVLPDFAGELELLRRIIEQPSLNFELAYNTGPKLLLPHLIKIKRAAELLSYSTVCDLHRGETASAVTNTRAVLALCKGWDERLLISELVRIAATQIAVPPTWELLQSDQITEEELSALQRDWEALEFVRAAEIALQMERAWGEQTLAQMRTNDDLITALGWGNGRGSSALSSSGNWLEDLGQMTRSAWENTRYGAAVALWRGSWSYTDELLCLQGEQVLIEAARRVETNGFFCDAILAATNRLTAIGIGVSSDEDGSWFGTGGNLRHLLSSSVASLSRVLNRVMAVETARQLCVSAIALKRYRLRHGAYPKELSALVPEFLSAVPRDPADGKPLRYKSNGIVFQLYSVGEDGVDDGGDPSPVKPSVRFYFLRGRDWVWPLPADEKEVRSFHESGVSTQH